MSRRYLSLFTFVSVCSIAPLLICIGCSESTLPVFPATGKLVINGQPAVGAIVGLHPSNGDFDGRGTRPAGVVGKDGMFAISSFGIKDGAPVGSYTVSIFWPQFPERDDPGDDRLAGRFTNPKTSNLSIEIVEGENDLEPILLEGVKILPGKPDSKK